MKQFVNRIFVLVLTLVVTAAMSFAADGYKNTVMALNFEPVSDNNFNIVVQTKTAYGNTLSPIRKDANTYVLMLPDTDSSASTPDLTDVDGRISSVQITTMPRTSNAGGYTKITVRTSSPINLTGKNTVYNSNDKYGRNSSYSRRRLENDDYESSNNNTVRRYDDNRRSYPNRNVSENRSQT